MWYLTSKRLYGVILVAAVAGLVGSVSAQTNLGRVSIDIVGHQYIPTMLLAGNVHRVQIRYDFRACSASKPWGTGNSFEIYSPDGADWMYFKGSDGPLVQALPPTVSRYRKHYYSTNNGASWTLTGGMGADSASGSGGSNTRVAYSLATIDFTLATGFIGGTDNGIAVVLEFTTSLDDHGRTMCFDTTKATGVPAWEWAAVGSSDRPIWDNGLGVSGPRCWEIYELPCGPYPTNQSDERAAAPDVLCNYCCNIRVGDANGSGEEIPTLGDITTMVDAKFITGSCDGVIPCLMEADINRSAVEYPTCDDITLSDITMLIDYLFITGPSGGPLPDCI